MGILSARTQRKINEERGKSGLLVRSLPSIIPGNIVEPSASAFFAELVLNSVKECFSFIT